MDRFGLRVLVKGLEKKENRLEAYRRTRAFLENRRSFTAQYQESTAIFREEIQGGRQSLKNVALPEDVARMGLDLIEHLELDSLRAEITLFEAARAHAVADGRSQVLVGDIRAVAPMSLRLRRSQFIEQYLEDQNSEARVLEQALDNFMGPDDPAAGEEA
jgi:Mg-chelatase subunit ChlI